MVTDLLGKLRISWDCISGLKLTHTDSYVNPDSPPLESSNQYSRESKCGGCLQRWNHHNDLRHCPCRLTGLERQGWRSESDVVSVMGQYRRLDLYVLLVHPLSALPRLTLLVAIVVGCLPPFAIFLRSRVIASRAYDYNPSESRASVQPSRVKSRIRAESILLDDVQPTGLATKESGSMKGENTQPWAPPWQQSRVEAGNEHEEMKEGRGIQITHTVFQSSKNR